MQRFESLAAFFVFNQSLQRIPREVIPATQTFFVTLPFEVPYTPENISQHNRLLPHNPLIPPRP
jgi:hypothetical protein